MSKKFDGDYLYMLCDISGYPISVYTDLNKAIKLLEINKNLDRGIRIWVNHKIETKIITFNGSYYDLMMQFVDDFLIPRELVREVRQILNPYIEEELERIKIEEENERKETERKELQELYRLAEKYSKTITD